MIPSIPTGKSMNITRSAEMEIILWFVGSMVVSSIVTFVILRIRVRRRVKKRGLSVGELLRSEKQKKKLQSIETGWVDGGEE